VKLTRQEDISLYLYLRDRIIMPQYAELSEGYGLVSAGSNGVWNIDYSTEIDIRPFRRGEYSGLGRGLVYFDVINDVCSFGLEQDEMVVVKDGSGGELERSQYAINYLNGQIISEVDLTSYTVDYYWYYVSILDAWPSEEVPALPVVSVELQLGDSKPLQLGGGAIREASWNVQIFANNKGERDDLMDVIYEGVYQKRCPIYTYENGLPLRYDGQFNSNFSVVRNTKFPSLFFENVEKRLSGLPSWGFYETEIVNKYRAEITFETMGYQQSE